MFLLNTNVLPWCLGKRLYRHIMADLALNISRDNKIGICPNYLRMSAKCPEQFLTDKQHVTACHFQYHVTACHF